MNNEPIQPNLINFNAGKVERLPELVAIDVEDANRLGQRHYLAGDFARAEECFLAVVRADPNHAFGWGNLGLIWQHTGFWDDAFKCMMRSHDLNPKNPQNITNLGYLHDSMGMHDHAVRFYQLALELDPTNPRALANLGHNYVKRLDFERGWPLMEARFNTLPKMSVMREYPFPIWDGNQVKRLAIWPEQGVGDQLVYSTMLPDLIARGQDFVCELDERLIPAFERSFPYSTFVPRRHGSGFDGCDAHIPMMSMARYLRTSVADFGPQMKPLLLPPVDRAPIYYSNKKRIAISWRSFHPSINIAMQTRKSAPLSAFARLMSRDDLDLVSVQYGDVNAEIEEFGRGKVRKPAIDTYKDIEGVLAIIADCDAVVTTSNVTAHFAGALGVPTYLIYLRANPPFFYWTPDEDGRSLWYRSVRIVTGKDVTTWEEAIELVSGAL